MTPSTTPPGATRRWSRGGRGALLGTLCLLLVLALLTGAAAVWGRPALYAAGLLVDGGRPTLDPDVRERARPTPTPARAPGAPELLAAAGEGREPAADPLADRVRDVPRTGLGGRLDLTVTDVATGEVVLREGGDGASMPASTQKLATAAAALHLLGPDHVFTTTVERRGGLWVLVGGGDPLLTATTSTGYPVSASLQQLAEQTARAAAAAGVARVDLALDDSLFSGPTWSPDWPENYRDQVTPVNPLVVDQGRLAGVSPGPRERQPGRAALDRFAELLAEQGLEVGEVLPEPDVATGQDEEGGVEVVAEVASPPVGVLVEEMLMTSDNDIAELLFRHVGLAAGEPGSFEGGGAAVGRALAELGVEAPGRASRDGSGLARSDRLTSTTLTDLLALALGEDEPALRPLLTGLPLAGGTGSLTTRFGDEASAPGRGAVWAKTGTLRGTHALAGYLRTADGRLLAFAFLLNDVENDYAARVWLDRAAAAVSSCGC